MPGDDPLRVRLVLYPAADLDLAIGGALPVESRGSGRHRVRGPLRLERLRRVCRDQAEALDLSLDARVEAGRDAMGHPGHRSLSLTLFLWSENAFRIAKRTATHSPVS